MARVRGRRLRHCATAGARRRRAQWRRDCTYPASECLSTVAKWPGSVRSAGHPGQHGRRPSGDLAAVHARQTIAGVSSAATSVRQRPGRPVTPGRSMAASDNRPPSRLVRMTVGRRMPSDHRRLGSSEAEGVGQVAKPAGRTGWSVSSSEPRVRAAPDIAARHQHGSMAVDAGQRAAGGRRRSAGTHHHIRRTKSSHTDVSTFASGHRTTIVVVAHPPQPQIRHIGSGCCLGCVPRYSIGIRHSRQALVDGPTKKNQPNPRIHTRSIGPNSGSL